MMIMIGTRMWMQYHHHDVDLDIKGSDYYTLDAKREVVQNAAHM